MLTSDQHPQNVPVAHPFQPAGFFAFRTPLLPFEVLSILLLVAMVGVILLSKKDLK